MLKPLEINVEQYGRPEGILSNIEHALTLDLEDLQIGLVRHDGIFVIVGSGPSVVHQVDALHREVAKGRVICAVNGVYDFLVDNGITPSLFLTVDPRAMTGVEPRPHVNNIKQPQAQTIYMLASRCHPTIFEYLKDYKVMRWHAYGKEDENEALEGHMLVGGGTTSGLRAFTAGYMQGFRHFHLYGMDSCLGERREKRWNSEPLTDKVETTDVIVGDRAFICNMAMAAQANEFQNIWDIMPDAHVEVYGGGLLAAIMRERHVMGLPC